MTHVLITTDGSEQSLKAARYLRSLLDPASLERVSVLAVVRPLAAVPFASDFGEEETPPSRPRIRAATRSIGRRRRPPSASRKS